MFPMLGMMGMGIEPGKPLKRDSVGKKFIISTVYAHDVEEWETAVLDEDAASPVERYSTEEEAIKGHDRWVKKGSGLKRVLVKEVYGKNHYHTLKPMTKKVHKLNMEVNA